MMVQVGDHPNVVSLIGASSIDGRCMCCCMLLPLYIALYRFGFDNFVLLLYASGPLGVFDHCKAPLSIYMEKVLYKCITLLFSN